jgi:hypothetical protein
MTSFTPGSFHEPLLLFYQPRGGPSFPGWVAVIGRAAQQCDRAALIKPTQLVSAKLLEFFAGFFPGLHPTAAESDLLR